VLYELVKEGAVTQLGRGIYGLREHSPTENHSYAEALKRTPQGILCLLSALRYHDLTVQNPDQVWIAVPRSAWCPRANGIRLRVVRFSGQALVAGVERHTIEGVNGQVTSVARTVADCFKYRNKIGLDVAREALSEGWKRKRFTVDEIWRYAKMNRVTKVIMPYLESLAAS